MNFIQLVRRGHAQNESAMLSVQQTSQVLRDLRPLENEMSSLITFGTDEDGVLFQQDSATTLLQDALAALSELNEKLEVLKTYSRLVVNSHQAPPHTEKGGAGWQLRRRNA
jgi:hypothetical protein